MKRSSNLFGHLLTEAIYKIEFRESKSVQIVQDELGYALGRDTGGSAIEYWRKGNIPSRQSDIEGLAREIIRRSDFDCAWLENFLKSSGYTQITELCDELFPQTSPVSPWQINHRSGPSASSGHAGEFVEELAPFVVGPPIIHCRQFFGRENELKRIFGVLNRIPLQNIAIIGLQRSGKTSLLHYLKHITSASKQQLRPDQRTDWLKQPEHYKWVFVDFQDARMGRQEWLLRYMLTELGMPLPDRCDLIGFMETVSHNLRFPAIILMDEIGAALESTELDQRFWWSMRSLGTNQTGGKLAFILTSNQSPDQQASAYGKPSPFFNIFQRLDLGPLTEPAARELIASSPMRFDAGETAWIINESGRWPALLQILCHSYLTALTNGQRDQAWRIDGLRQMMSYRYLLGDP